MKGISRIVCMSLIAMAVLISVTLAEIAPSVQLRPIKDEAKVGEPCIFEASIVNPISPDGKNMTAQIILKVPPNVVVYGESFVKSGSGQYVAVFENIPPGDAVHERVYVKGLKAGEYIVSADLIWYYEGEQTPHINSLDYAVKFVGSAPTPTTPTPTPTITTPTPPPPPPQPPEIPWQYIVIISIIAIVVVVALVVRVLK